MKRFLSITLLLLGFVPASIQAQTNSTRNERNYIVEGNKLYHDGRYAEAEVAYRKALQENAMNEIAQFNLAASLLRQGSASGETQKEASTILQNLTRDAENISIAEKAFYNLGNIAFNSQDYAKSIDLYKNALRRNPDNDNARENLRLAQKRLQEQQNNQDQNKDQNNQDQDKKDQDKEQQQNQNKDQNQDQNKDHNQDQDQNKQDQKQPQDQKQQPQQQNGISQQNAEKILKAMENEENATRARINAEKKKSGAPTRRPVTNPW